MSDLLKYKFDYMSLLKILFHIHLRKSQIPSLQSTKHYMIFRLLILWTLLLFFSLSPLSAPNTPIPCYFKNHSVAFGGEIKDVRVDKHCAYEFHEHIKFTTIEEAGEPSEI